MVLTLVQSKGKGKVRPRTGHEGPEGEWRYSSALFLISLYGGGWSTPRPGRFTPGKHPVPIVKKAGRAPGPVWMGSKNLAPLGFDPCTVQLFTNRYTDCTIPAHPWYRHLRLFGNVSCGRFVPTEDLIKFNP
jgi:hypothetical protein